MRWLARSPRTRLFRITARVPRFALQPSMLASSKFLRVEILPTQPASPQSRPPRSFICTTAVQLPVQGGESVSKTGAKFPQGDSLLRATIRFTFTETSTRAGPEALFHQTILLTSIQTALTLTLRIRQPLKSPVIPARPLRLS